MFENWNWPSVSVMVSSAEIPRKNNWTDEPASLVPAIASSALLVAEGNEFKRGVGGAKVSDCSMGWLVDLKSPKNAAILISAGKPKRINKNSSTKTRNKYLNACRKLSFSRFRSSREPCLVIN